MSKEKIEEKTVTYHLKLSEKEAASIKDAANDDQRTVHNWLRVAVLFYLKRSGKSCQ